MPFVRYKEIRGYRHCTIRSPQWYKEMRKRLKQKWMVKHGIIKPKPIVIPVSFEIFNQYHKNNKFEEVRRWITKKKKSKKYQNLYKKHKNEQSGYRNVIIAAAYESKRCLLEYPIKKWMIQDKYEKTSQSGYTYKCNEKVVIIKLGQCVKKTIYKKQLKRIERNAKNAKNLFII